MPEHRLMNVLSAIGNTSMVQLRCVVPAHCAKIFVKLEWENPSVYDVAEFFVMRKYRRHNVGRHAALLLWAMLPGRWTVRVSEGNAGALQFWRRIVSDFTDDSSVESTIVGTPHAWRVLSLDSAARARS